MKRDFYIRIKYFTMRNLALVMIVLLAVIMFITGCTTIPPAPASGPAPTVSSLIVVDALLPLTGSYSSFGEMAQAALLTAEKDINEYYQAIGSPARVTVVIHDTGSDPDTALRLVQAVHADGRRIVLGHMTSAEIAAIKGYTDTNGMVVLDAGSTSPALAIPGDSIYRLISDDSTQGQVMGVWLARNTIDAIVPIWRGDIWGDGLLNATRAAFAERNGVTLEGVRFDPAATDFAAPVSSLDILAGDAVRTYGAGRVGIYIIGFDETAPILNEASGRQNLSQIRWFGCDGNTGVSALTGLTPAARFAARVNLTGTVWGIAHGNPLDGPQTRIRERLGFQPSSGPVALYDALWVVKDISEEIPAGAGQAQIEAALVRHMNTYDGESRSLKPNEAGDRSLASYDIMQVFSGSAGSGWQKIANVIIWTDGREEITIIP
jgi:branched-chain amino acid transport system substrate-binding protein